MRKLVACLACRNEGSRLYGKPLQNLDIKKKISILQYIIDCLKKTREINSIILAISNNIQNKIYEEIAKKNNINFIYGHEINVLSRLVKSCEKEKGTDLFRITTESPFFLFEKIPQLWKVHIKNNYDLTTIDDVPDGSGFEIVNLKAYKLSLKNGKRKHKSEFCSLYIRENKKKFNFYKYNIENIYKRKDLRLTADYPEDLIVLREIYSNFKKKYPKIPLKSIIRFLDKKKNLKKLISKYTNESLKLMNI